MSKTTYIFALLLMLIHFDSKGQKGADWCGTDAIQTELFKNDPNGLSDFQLEQMNFNDFASKYNPSTKKTTIIVPTVVHVFHFNNNGNISEAQVLDGIRMINEDLKRINADTVNTRNIFKPFAGSMDIEFRLAKKDPQGNCTNGIVRVNSGAANNFQSDDALISRWPNDQYFNIWIVNDIYNFTGGGGVILGYAYYPSNFNNPRYGVVNRNDAWGSIGSIIYQGRTPTHEVGHALNLPHTFNDACGFNCSNSGDYVCDTPPASSPTSGCNFSFNTCTNDTIGPDPFTGDMPNQIENYMSYDDCQNMFSLGQVSRMEAALAFYNTLTNLTSPSNVIATGVDDAYFFMAPACTPIADFTSNKKTNCEDGEIQFTDISYNSNPDSTWQWSWSFPGANPSTSTARNPLVTYPAAGDYNVSLVVSNGVGNSPTNTKSNFIKIREGSGSFVAPKTIYFSNPEFPANNSDASLSWEILNPQNGNITWMRNTNAFFSGPSSVSLNNFDITSEQFHSLVTPVVDLTQLSDVYLNFQLAYARKSNEVELLTILTSQDCGATWKTLITELSINLYSTSGTSASFIPAGPQDWRPYSLHIPNFAGKDNLLFRVEFKARGGNNIYIDDFEISDSPLTGINRQIKSENTLRIFPNPGNGIFNISTGNESMNFNALILVNSIGQVVKTIPIENNLPSKIDLSGVKKGVYSLHFIGKENKVKKVIIE